MYRGPRRCVRSCAASTAAHVRTETASQPEEHTTRRAELPIQLERLRDLYLMGDYTKQPSRSTSSPPTRPAPNTPNQTRNAT